MVCNVNLVSSTEFRRARTPEQREARRLSILSTAASMLGEMPVAEVSLNELSRRVGLAKSNVLHYFESREAILLDLLDTQIADWAGDLDERLTPSAASLADRASMLARILTTTMDARPVMCDLISAQAAVLERNISTEVALRYKRSVNASVARIDKGVIRLLPELDEADAYQVLSITFLMASACWPQAHPTEAVLGAYACDPEVAAAQAPFSEALGRTIDLVITGLLVHTETEQVADGR